MASLLPRPAAPRLAVACSGGADSLALALLAADWAAATGGTLVALTVDHRLRAESAAEACQVGRWLRQHGIDHQILVWRGRKPKANLSALAREARYRLLGDWCRANGCRILLLAHQREDQAETLLLRLARGSGLDGLAGMTPATERDGLLLLRPLLQVPRARLEAFLDTRRQPWVEDPSNRDPAYARSRMRALLPALAAEGLTAARLAATAERLAGSRATLTQLTEGLLAEAAQFNPAGFCLLDPGRLSAALPELSLRALARCLALISGSRLPPRFDRLQRLHAEILGDLGRGRTLQGCRILPWRGRLLICREAAAAAPPLRLVPGQTGVWDNRFKVRWRGGDRGGAPALTLGALGGEGWRRIRGQLAASDAPDLPGAVRPTLPALFDLDGVLAVPHLGYRRTAEMGELFVQFQPVRQPLRVGEPLLLPADAVNVC